MLGFIKKLFGSIFGLFGKLFGSIFGLFGSIFGFLTGLLPFGKKKTGEQAKAEAPALPQSEAKAVFLEGDEARGFSRAATNKPAAPAAQPAPISTATALNLPSPQVMTTNNASSTSTFKQFGPRRRPGANMKSFLDMAKTMKTS